MSRCLVTTAVAALLGAGSGFSAAAFADDTVELELGGYFIGSVSISDDEFTNISNALVDPDSYRFDGKSEVRFEGVSVLDSGLRYGFRAEVTVRNQAGSRAAGDDALEMVDQAFVFVDSEFGRVEIGQQEGVAGQFSVRSPHALGKMSAGDGRDDDIADPLALSPVGTVNDSSEDFAKITYMTPSFGGLKLGVSFTPDPERPSRALVPGDPEIGEDIVEFGVIYSRDFEDLSLDMSATWVSADAAPLAGEIPVFGELEEWNAGVNVGFRGLTVGGSYRESGSVTLGLRKYEAYDIGVAYETGPWKVSAQFAEHEGELAGAPYENGYRYLISARYKVAKGLRIGAGLQRDLDILTEEEGTAFILESALKF